MFGNAFGWPHLLIILAIVLLLFGAPKLPALARSVGQSMRIFRGEMKTMKSDDPAKPDEDATAKNMAGTNGAGPSAGGTDSPVNENPESQPKP